MTFILFAAGSYLLVHAYLAVFTRYMADDYCTANTLIQKGFWGAQIYIRNSYSGRYSFFLLDLLIQSLGMGTIFITSTFVMGLWFLSLARIIYVLLIFTENKTPFIGSLLLSSCVLWASYESIVDFPQIMYWRTGVLTYSLFNFLVLLESNFILHRVQKSANIRAWELLAWGGFSFWVGGFSEVGNAVQIVLINSILVSSQ